MHRYRIWWVLWTFLLGYNIFSHTMWFDELQAWGLVVTSENIFQVVDRVTPEGHPPLWHLFLYPLSRVTTEPLIMQAGVFLVGAANLALIWFQSPFSTTEKNLLCASFQFGYNFSVFSRPYCLGSFFMLAFLAVRSESRLTMTVRWALLGLLAFTHIYFTPAAFVLGIFWLRRCENPVTVLRASWPYFLGNCLLSLSVLRLYYLLPPIKIHPALALFPPVLIHLALLLACHFRGESRTHRVLALLTTCSLAAFPLYLVHRRLDFKFQWVALQLEKFGTGLLPVVNPLSINYWDFSHQPVAGTVLCLLVVVLAVLYFRPQRIALGLLLLLCASMSIVFLSRHRALLWHIGVVFLTAVALVWFCRDKKLTLGPRKIFLLFLCIQAVVGVRAFVLSKVNPLSSIQATALWLKENTDSNSLVMGLNPFPTSVLGNYLGRPIFFPKYSEFVRHNLWRHSPLSTDPRSIRASMSMLGRREAWLVVPERSIRIVEGWNAEEPRPPLQFRRRAHLRDSLHEHFVVYQVNVTHEETASP